MSSWRLWRRVINKPSLLSPTLGRVKYQSGLRCGCWRFLSHIRERPFAAFRISVNWARTGRSLRQARPAAFPLWVNVVTWRSKLSDVPHLLWASIHAIRAHFPAETACVISWRSRCSKVEK